MQISNNSVIQNGADKQSPYTNTSGKNDFSSILRKEEQSFRQQKNDTSVTQPKSQSANSICLGTVKATSNPTVSHLLVKHPEYGQDCWQIIHSDINSNKEYTKIPSGTKIYLNPETNELTWDSNANPDPKTGAEQDTPYLSALDSRQTVGNRQMAYNDNGLYSLKKGTEIEQHIQVAAQRHNIPARLIRAVIKAESNYRPQAVSEAGAKGLMQLMPETAQELGVNNPFDVKENIEGGTQYLRKMLDSFDGDVKLALAAYNAGPNAVKSHEGLIPYQETQLYVQKVLDYFQDTSSPI